MQAHAFVLHLTRARKRRDNAHALKENCGLPGELWAAVDGTALDAADLSAETGARLFQPTYPFPLKPGEIGCFLSHRQIWAEILRRDLDHALILEDDVTLDPDTFPRALALATANIGACGYIQLQDRPPQSSPRLIDQSGPCRLTLADIPQLRTSAQLVSHAAARRLLDASETIDRPIDAFLQCHWHTGLRPAAIHPAGIRTIADQLDGSTIQGGRKSLAEKLWREVARFRYRRGLARHARASTAPLPEGLQ